MKKSPLLVALAAASVGFTSPLFAAPAESGPYIGAKIGVSIVDKCDAGYNDAKDLYSKSCDDSALAYGGYIGYNFIEYLGLEFGYDSLGKHKSYDGYNNVDKNITAFYLTPRFILPIGENFDIFAKAGAAYVEYNDLNDTVVTAGLGAEMFVTDNVALRLEYQYYDDLNDGYIKNLSTHFVSLGVTAAFGSEPEVVEEPVFVPVPEPEPEVVIVPVVIKEQKAQSFQNLFPNNSSKLAPGTAGELNSIANVLLENSSVTTRIVGHTDSNGAAAYNQKMSEARAKSVATYLESKGVNADQINASGEGESNPIATNKTAAGRAENRRVDIYLPSFEY